MRRCGSKARCERERVQIAVGIDAAGKRHLLAVELADRETDNSWTTFLTGLKERGLQGIEYVVSDSHEGLKRAIEKVLTTALWQRCAVHFLRNAVAHTTPSDRSGLCRRTQASVELQWHEGGASRTA